MKEYLMGAVVLIFAVDMLGILAHEKYKEITEAALGVVLTLALILPLPKLVSEIGNKIRFPEIESTEGEDIYLLSFEEGIAEFVVGKFGVPREEIEVEAIGFSQGGMRAEKIVITLHGTAALADYKKIGREVEELSLGEVEVKIEI